MIKIAKRYIGLKDFYLLYQMLKQKEFTINLGTMGIHFQIKGGYVEVSIVALGQDFGKIVYLTKENLIKKEKVIVEKIVKVKPKKKTVEYHNDDNKVEEEDLF